MVFLIQYSIFRGKRMKKTPSTVSGYASTAWYRYTDTTCDYGCQAMEYLWWGYCSYTGVCAGRAGSWYEDEFKLLKKADLKQKDTGLYNLYAISEAKTAAYRLPTKFVDGVYTGCQTCARNPQKSHGGK